ncbi:TPA: hypothetical protein RPV57_000569 [Campylobacter fetus]|uniref:hypothetical protein n=1 Tax=Campylobacter fetus TaxID=196 RepID=UPI00288CC531|nr:hypothetical protein [Campylobacter fetus]HEG4795376.1 hypothetical protein [Campylobacter fetus]HEG5097642.1 hypothetical protein [Campylobacter fetus]HEG6042831.1 hypothetical protein [Campylobacter fetus]
MVIAARLFSPVTRGKKTKTNCNTVRLVPAVKDWIELGKTTGIIIGGSGIYK